MPRRNPLATLAGLAVVLAAGAFVLWPQPSRITKSNYDRIKIGMSRKEVEAILGPSGDYTTGPVRSPGGMAIDYSDSEFTHRLESHFLGSVSWWADDNGAADVLFDDGGQVRAMEFGLHAKEPCGALDAFFWQAKRQWRRWFR